MDDNATLDASEGEIDETFDLDALEEKIDEELATQLAEITFLEGEQEKIGSPEALGETVMNAVLEQCINQIAAVAGEDFIKENEGLTLDLRNKAHIQTTENFEQGVIATHNHFIKYQERYDKWQDNFRKDEFGEPLTHDDSRLGQAKKILKTQKYDGVDARADFDKGRPTGSKTVNKDHTISAAEIIRDPRAAAHLSRDEQIAFANSDINLIDLDSAANKSKGDLPTPVWLKSKRPVGGEAKTPAERFPIDEEKLLKQDQIAREKYGEKLDEGEQRSIETGKQSQKEEFFRCSGKALRAAVMALLAGLVKEIIQKLITWFRSAHKSVKSLLESFKSAIISFVKKLQTYLVNATSIAAGAVASMIWEKAATFIRSVFALLKQGWRSLKEAIDYIQNPQNREKSISIILMEIGKIVTAGLSAGSAIVLGQVIEKGLMAFPPLAVQIPMLGSVASLVGLFMGALVSGVTGAIVLHLIDKAIAEQRGSENVCQQIGKRNDVLMLQAQMIESHQEKLAELKKRNFASIKERHETATSIISESLHTVFGGDSIIDHEDDFGGMDDALRDLLK